MPDRTCFVCRVAGAERVIYLDGKGRPTLLALCLRCQSLAGERVPLDRYSVTNPTPPEKVLHA